MEMYRIVQKPWRKQCCKVLRIEGDHFRKWLIGCVSAGHMPGCNRDRSFPTGVILFSHNPVDDFAQANVCRDITPSERAAKCRAAHQRYTNLQVDCCIRRLFYEDILRRPRSRTNALRESPRRDRCLDEKGKK